jgi:hypothetical protein
MHYRLACCALFLAGAGSARADEDFTHKLTPEEFAAAGLGKLTPAELAKLDTLIHAHEAGAVAVAQVETTRSVTAKVKAEDRQEAQKQANDGLLERVRVMLKPGTEIVYSELDAAIPPGFLGFERGTVITLDNGQRWKVVDDANDYFRKTTRPLKVRITAGKLGGFWMDIETSLRPQVKFVGSSFPAPTPAPPPHP